MFCFMKKTITINGKDVCVKFRYESGDDTLWSNWNDLVKYWAPYYDSAADADEHLRRTVPGAIITAGGLTILQARKCGPLTSKEKRALLEEASKTQPFYTIENY